MSTGNPELFVVCKSCGSEVSPYITECPYCGNRLRKRAPKIDRDGRVKERRRRRPPRRRCRGCDAARSPGSARSRARTRRSALVLAGLVGCLLWRTSAVTIGQIAVFGEKPGSHWWRLITSGFVYSNTGYAFITLGAIAIFGWLLERRHGPLPVIALYAVGAVGGTAAAAAVYSVPVVLGANGGALALIVAWAIPDVLALRRGEEIEGDLLGRARDRARGRADAAGRAHVGVDRRPRGRPGRGRDRASARAQRTAIAPARAVHEPADPRPGTAAACSGGERDEQPARGHRVGYEPAARLGHAVRRTSRTPRRGRGCAAYPRRPRRHRGRTRSSSTPSIAGTASASISAARPLASRELVQVAEQPEAGDVGHRVRPGRARRRGAVAVERRHHLDRPVDRGAGDAALDRGRDRARAERLGQDERVAGAGRRRSSARHRARRSRSPTTRTSAPGPRSSARRRSRARRRRRPRRRHEGSRAAPPRRAARARTRPG